MKVGDLARSKRTGNIHTIVRMHYSPRLGRATHIWLDSHKSATSGIAFNKFNELYEVVNK